MQPALFNKSDKTEVDAVLAKKVPKQLMYQYGLRDFGASIASNGCVHITGGTAISLNESAITDYISISSNASVGLKITFLKPCWFSSEICFNNSTSGFIYYSKNGASGAASPSTNIVSRIIQHKDFIHSCSCDRVKMAANDYVCINVSGSLSGGYSVLRINIEDTIYVTIDSLLN